MLFYDWINEFTRHRTQVSQKQKGRKNDTFAQQSTKKPWWLLAQTKWQLSNPRISPEQGEGERKLEPNLAVNHVTTTPYPTRWHSVAFTVRVSDTHTHTKKNKQTKTSSTLFFLLTPKRDSTFINDGFARLTQLVAMFLIVVYIMQT